MGLTHKRADATPISHELTDCGPLPVSAIPPPWTPPTDPQVRGNLLAQATDLERYGLLNVTRAELARWNAENPPPSYRHVGRHIPPEYILINPHIPVEGVDIVRWREDVATAFQREPEKVAGSVESDASNAGAIGSDLIARDPSHQHPASSDGREPVSNLEESRRQGHSPKRSQRQFGDISTRRNHSLLDPTDLSLCSPTGDCERMPEAPLVRLPTRSACTRTPPTFEAGIAPYNRQTLTDSERRGRDGPVEARQPSEVRRVIGQVSGEKRRRESDPEAEKRRCRIEDSGMGRANASDDGQIRRALDARDPLYRYPASAGHRQTASEPGFTVKRTLYFWLNGSAVLAGYDRVKRRFTTICLTSLHMKSGSGVAPRGAVM